MKLMNGIMLIILAQIISFVQLQSQNKWPWARDHQWVMVLAGLPIGYLFLNSTRLINDATGATWPGRLLGQGVGVIMFALLSWVMFREPITVKTGVCIALALCVVMIQIFWK